VSGLFVARNSMCFANAVGSKFGSSLSYLSADGTSAAASSTVLDNVVIGDSTEFAIFSDVECTSDDADCGFYRDGSVAYRESI
jgi:hypothetical protein